MWMRSMTLGFLCVAAIATTRAVGAQASPEIVRGLCQKDGCAEFVVEQREPVGKGPDGALFRTRVRTFHVDHVARREGGVEDGYVYCSRSRPAVISSVPGRPVSALFIAPFEPKPGWALRSTANFYSLYFAICEGPDAGRRAAEDRAGLARSLGYSTTLTEPRTATLSKPEDVMSPAQR